MAIQGGITFLSDYPRFVEEPLKLRCLLGKGHIKPAPASPVLTPALFRGLSRGSYQSSLDSPSGRAIADWGLSASQRTMKAPSNALDFYLKTYANILMNMSSRFLVLAGCKHRGYCKSERRLDGKTVVVTGANTGLGRTTSEFLWKRGANVVLVCRDKSRGEAAMDEMKRALEPGVKAGKLELVLLDLSSFDSIRGGAEELNKLPRIDVLINNAGVMTPPFTLTGDGFELQFAVNHLGHFLLTLLLLPKLMESTPARIVNVSSVAHTFFSELKMEDLNDPEKYYGIFAYFRSKIANILFTRELAKRLRGTGVNVYGLNPGYIATELYRYSSKTFMPGFKFIMHNIMSCYVKDVWEGSQTIIHCAICEAVEEETGLYYDECQVEEMNPLCRDEELCAWFWDKSMEWTGLDPAVHDPSTYSRRTPSGKEDNTSLTTVAP